MKNDELFIFASLKIDFYILPIEDWNITQI